MIQLCVGGLVLADQHLLWFWIEICVPFIAKSPCLYVSYLQ